MVAEQREEAARSELGRGLRPADGWVDPVESGTREHGLELTLGEREVLEPCGVEPHLVRFAQPPARGLGHPRARLDRIHGQVAFGEQFGQLARTGADLQNTRPAVELAPSHRRVDKQLRIARADVVVELGNVVKPLCRSRTHEPRLVVEQG